MIKGKKIILAVSGSIAAYKAVYLCRLLIKSGAEVKVIMSESAEAFVGPLSFSVLSKNPVYRSLFSTDGHWNNHVELGLWADVFLFAPATANSIAKMANGLCDNLLLATYLSAKCPVVIAPAMDLDMWKHPATKVNIEKIKSFGNTVLEVGQGELASGLEGEGRMMEPEDIMRSLERMWSN